MARIAVELFGVPRLRTGCSRLELEASTASDALGQLGQACPSLVGTVLREGWLHPAYRLSLNSDTFVTDPETTLSDGDALLLLAADVGG